MRIIIPFPTVVGKRWDRLVFLSMDNPNNACATAEEELKPYAVGNIGQTAGQGWGETRRMPHRTADMAVKL